MHWIKVPLAQEMSVLDWLEPPSQALPLSWAVQPQTFGSLPEESHTLSDKLTGQSNPTRLCKSWLILPCPLPPLLEPVIKTG